MTLDTSQDVPFREALTGRVNTEHATIYANIRANIRRQLPQVMWYQPSGHKVLLLCGGPSLADNLAEIRRYIRRGWFVMTVNGTHAWSVQRGINPSLHAQLDARPFNARFVAEPVDTCRYLLCSQCDPLVFDALRAQDVHVWHGASRKDPEAKILDRFYRGRWQDVLGGSTVGTRAIGLLMLLGVRHVRIYGMDGCLRAGEHHAFEQPENDGGHNAVRRVRVGRRIFYAHLWMLAQLDDWLQMAPHVPDAIQLAIVGNGMLAHIVKETATRGRVPRIRVES